ncbi:MAG: glycosyltransferase family 4 protein, partial [Bryobacteraceae bacterium]
VAKHRCRYTVCTFHDLFVMTGDYSSPEFRARFTEQAKEAAAASDLIVTVSRFTAGQVSSLLGIPSSRIRVIYHGVRVPPNTARSIQREPIILFVGAIQRRKNIARLVEAFENTVPGWRLVLAGGLGFDAQEIVERIQRSSRRTDIELAGYVTGAALELLYRRASIFAFPSLDEGFGMPILDAMARGVPVLTSDRSAMPEVAGDAALLVNPDDIEALREGLRTLILDETLRGELATRGFSRSLSFMWESALQQTWTAYRELTGLQ